MLAVGSVSGRAWWRGQSSEAPTLLGEFTGRANALGLNDMPNLWQGDKEEVIKVLPPIVSLPMPPGLSSGGASRLKDKPCFEHIDPPSIPLIRLPDISDGVPPEHLPVSPCTTKSPDRQWQKLPLDQCTERSEKRWKRCTGKL